MGYTHYWELSPKAPPTKLSRTVREMSIIANVAKHHNPWTIPLAYSLEYHRSGNRRLYTNITLNGVDAGAYEPFVFNDPAAIWRVPGHEYGKPWNFCKTEFRPYDVVVTACLTLAKHHLGKRLLVRSDGTLKEWGRGIRLAEYVINGRHTWRDPNKGPYPPQISLPSPVDAHLELDEHSSDVEEERGEDEPRHGDHGA